MSTRKGDGSVKVYHVHLTDEGRKFFESACAGRGSKDLIFTKADGSQWQKSDQARPMLDASARTKINPPVNFHCLRHTYASHSIMNGAPLIVVATNLGHSDTRMVELHYGHLAPSYLASAIRDAAPRFGFKQERNIGRTPRLKGGAMRQPDPRLSPKKREEAAVSHVVELIRAKVHETRVLAEELNPHQEFGEEFETALRVRTVVNFLQDVFAIFDQKSPWGNRSDNTNSLADLSTHLTRCRICLRSCPVEFVCCYFHRGVWMTTFWRASRMLSRRRAGV